MPLAQGIRRRAGRIGRPCSGRQLLESLESRILLSYSEGVLAAFTGMGVNGNGNQPSGLVMAPNGDLYGVTALGGVNNLGTIFKIAAGSATVTTLASFNGTAGFYPYGKLVLDGSGNLFGTTVNGVKNRGTVFELAAGASTISILATFDGKHGSYPISGLVADGSGDLFGVAHGISGSAFANPTLFEIPAGSSTVVTLAMFRNGAVPLGALVVDGSGNIFGTTINGGGNNQGSIFELPSSGSTINTLASFNGANGNAPAGNLILSGGVLYGTTLGGGKNGDGEIFSFNLAATSPAITVVASFNGTNGNRPVGDLILDGSGNFFGVTAAGGSNGNGVVFELPSGTTTIAALFSFRDSSTGAYPTGPLVMDGNGTLIGATNRGGPANKGLIFELSPDTAPQVAVRLVIQQQPTNALAGHAVAPAVTVLVEDALGRVVTGDTSSVTLALSPTTGTLTGTTTVAAVAGVATFSGLTVDTSGKYTLAATDGSLTGASSKSFTISADAANNPHLVFAPQPVYGTVNVALNPAVLVDIVDNFGNLISSGTESNSKVTLSLGAGPGTLSGTLVVNAIGGVATFANLKLNATGSTYSLHAVDGTLGAADSSVFTIGAALRLSVTQQPQNAVAGATMPDIKVAILDGGGHVITTDTSSVTLAVNPTSGTLTGTTTVAAVNGVATFHGLVMDTAGKFTVTATDGGIPAATSNSYTITAAAASQLVITQQPTDTAPNAPITPAVVVKIEDAFGNVRTGDSSSVQVSDLAGAVLGGNTTVRAVNGVATFANLSVQATASGAHTLHVVDLGAPAVMVDSNAFNVNLTATRLVFTQQPTTTVAGQTISTVVVKLEDGQGNIITDDTSSVTLSLTPPNNGATINGTVTVATVAGVATFSGLSLNTAGTYTLQATDGTLTPGISALLVITPAAATQLAFTVQPSGAAHGVKIAPAVVVAVEDTFGNVVTTDHSTVTVMLVGTGGTLTGTTAVNANAGLAVFSNLVVSAAGMFTLQATDGALTLVMSSGFTIT